MDKLWINKLRELKRRMEEHLAEKRIFESLPERTSLAALREGQRLKRNGEQICNHFAQLAEFATGLPADRFDFSLDIQSPYETAADGKLIFGPPALIEEHPYVNFNTRILLGGEEKREEAAQQASVTGAGPGADFQPGSVGFSDEIGQKYDRPIFSILDEKRIMTIHPFIAESRIDHFIAKVSVVDKYIDEIVGKYMPEPPAGPEFEGFYIYEGDFVYLSRRGKWATLRTTVLAQKDYFMEAPVSAAISRRRFTLIEPFREIEMTEAADLISDEMAQPVGSAQSDLGLGYFLPGRRVGKTKGAAEDLPALPVMGSREFAEDVCLKAESSGHPIEEISPAYIFAAGKKIDRARSFARALRSRMQLPRSEPARKAVESLLPKMEEIITKSREQGAVEEAILAIERDFDSMVERHIKPFKIAAGSTAPSRISPVLREGRIERVLESPTQDPLGVIARYRAETIGRETPSAVILGRMSHVSSERLSSASESHEAIPGPAASGQSLLAGDVIGRLTRGFAGQIGERLGQLLRPSGSGGTGQADSRLPGQLARGTSGTTALPSVSALVSGARGLAGGLSGIASALGIGTGEESALSATPEGSPRSDSGAGPGRAAGSVGDLLSRGLSRASSFISSVPGAAGGPGSAASRAADLSRGLVERASSFAGGLSSIAGGFLQRATSGAAGRIGSLVGGRLGRLAQGAEGLMGDIGDLIGRGGGVQEEASGGAAPGGSMQDISPALGSGSLPFNLPQLQRRMPRGWDRPPFEVGDAIQRHAGEGLPDQVGSTTQRTSSRLQDYGLSLIDLDDERSEQVRSPLEAVQDEEEVELDEDTIESIYFRLKRILETEGERMGGEA
ncbi:MAG TPA: hypothetical protein ENO22_09620 [candidate division Zixibacteria bacterium]|nr:hypothetical protein [candidate division Zixibacteria bacterium]